MAPLPAVAQVVQAVLHYTDGGDLNAINKLFFHYSGTAPTGAGLAAAGSGINAAWIASGGMASFVSDTVELDTVEFTDLSSSSAAQGVAIVNAAGTNAGSLIGAGSAAVVKYLIPRRYRGGKPRSYVMGQVTGFLATSQTWTTGYTGGLATGWGQLIAGFLSSLPAGSGTWTHVNVSYFDAGARRVTPVVDTITGLEVNPRVASQRRRNLQGS